MEEFTWLTAIPEVPFKRILRYLSFNDVKNLRLTSYRLMRLTTSIVKKFNVYQLYVEDNSLPEDEMFMEVDLVLNLRTRSPVSLSSAINISNSQVLAWFEQCSQQLVGLKGVKPGTLAAITESQQTLSKLQLLEIECGMHSVDQEVACLPSFLQSVSSTLTSLSLLRVNLASIVDTANTTVFPQTPCLLPNLKNLEIYASRNARVEPWTVELISSCSSSLETVTLLAFEDFSRISQIGAEFPQLTTLVFHGYEYCSDIPGVSSLLQRCPALQTLDLKHIDLLDLVDIRVRVPSLKKLKLNFCIGNVGLLQLLQCCENLELLQIENQPHLDLAGFENFDIELSYLRELVVFGELMSFCSYVTINNLEKLLISCCRRLDELTLVSVDLSNFGDVDCDLKSLTKICINCSSSGGLNNILSRCSSVRRLFIIYDKFHRLPTLNMIHRLPSLTHLHIKGTGRDHWSSTDSLNHLFAACTSLHTLNTIGVSLTLSEIDELELNLPFLRTLVVCPQLQEYQTSKLMEKLPEDVLVSSVPSPF